MTIYPVSIITITPSDSARNLGVIFDASLTMSDHIFSVSKSCFMSICDLRRIGNTRAEILLIPRQLKLSLYL